MRKKKKKELEEVEEEGEVRLCEERIDGHFYEVSEGHGAE